MMPKLEGIVNVSLGIHLYCCKWTCAGVNNISHYERLDMLTSWQRNPHVSASQRGPQTIVKTAWPACLGAASVHTYCGLPGGALAVMTASLSPSRKLQSSPQLGRAGFGDSQRPCQVSGRIEGVRSPLHRLRKVIAPDLDIHNVQPIAVMAAPGLHHEVEHVPGAEVHAPLDLLPVGLGVGVCVIGALQQRLRPPGAVWLQAHREVHPVPADRPHLRRQGQ